MNIRFTELGRLLGINNVLGVIMPDKWETIFKFYFIKIQRHWNKHHHDWVDFSGWADSTGGWEYRISCM